MTAPYVKTIEEFDAELQAWGMRGQWQYDKVLESVIGGPKPAGVAHLWRWEDVLAKLVEACDVLPESFTARRNLTFLNPALGSGTTHTIAMGMQMLKPGEIAWAHRHTMAAIRFVIEGHTGLASVVDGEVCPMDPYDLVLTPRWAWHDHHNETSERAVWLDVLDLGLVLSLNAAFYEPFGEQRQPVRDRRSQYLSSRTGLVRPVWEQRKLAHLPIRYPWAEVEPRLLEMADLEGSPHDGIVLEYVNPVTGGPTLPTMSCWVQMLRPGEETQPHRHTSSSVYFVIRGQGCTVVDGKKLTWGPHDSFVVPNWSQHHFVNASKDSQAVLFSVNDIPVLDALDLYREEPADSRRASPWPEIPGNRATAAR